MKRLLQFTRTAPESETSFINLPALVRDAAQLTAPIWRDAAQAAGAPISLHVEAEHYAMVMGSPAQLREAMTNLIFNAVDAMPTGGTICLAVAVVDAEAVIEVSDSGSGMTAEIQERVFEPFFTTKGEGGSGLGLAMVFKIVDQHGGRITIVSAPGEGTTFCIHLPLALAEGETPPPEAPAEVPAVPHQLRVLVVDDEPMLARAVKRMLEAAGHMVSTAQSGEDALRDLNQQPVDLVISDLGMGAGMNGWELAEAVRESWPEVRFILSTGWGASIDPVEARVRGVEAVLAKPYRVEELYRVVGASEKVEPTL